MAQLVIASGDLCLLLNWLEKLADLSRRPVSVPVASIESIEVVENPHQTLLPTEVDFGFAGNGAPARKILTL
jgi:hypothetical protein